MALQPMMVSDFRVAAAAGQTPRDKEWKWVWNQEQKQGRWLHVSEKEEVSAPVKQVKPCKRPRRLSRHLHCTVDSQDPAAARSNTPGREQERITMAGLDEDSRRAADDRSAQLRRENARRIKQKQAASRKVEEEEQERIRRALEERKREIQATRSLITAGARARPTEVFFDDVEAPAMQPDVGEGVIRKPAQPREKQAWNGGVGPGSGAVRVGYQPTSLVPPPVLPPRRKPGAPGTAGTASSRTTTSSRAYPTSALPSSARGHSAASSRRQEAEEDELEQALARADQGLARARGFSAGPRGDAAGGGGGAAYAPPRSDWNDQGGGGRSHRTEHHHEEEESQGGYAGGGRGYGEDAWEGGSEATCSVAPSSLAFFNDRAPCSEGGGSRAGTGTGGRYGARYTLSTKH